MSIQCSISTFTKFECLPNIVNVWSVYIVFHITFTLLQSQSPFQISVIEKFKNSIILGETFLQILIVNKLSDFSHKSHFFYNLF